MNKQYKIKNGKLVSRGIEWCDRTWNPLGGCHHGCRWQMPDGKVAICYAESVANRVAQSAYPQGFDHLYVRPDSVWREPLNLKSPAKIFVGSMTDVFGHWVSDEHIERLLDVCRQAHWHDFLLLTKNPKRLTGFLESVPKNVWLGVSTPPDFMWGRKLTSNQKAKMLEITMHAPNQISRIGIALTWLSVEPLSWDISEILHDWPNAVNWVVIGAASDGPRYHQPNPVHLYNLLSVCDELRIPVFFKGNLKHKPYREEWPIGRRWRAYDDQIK